ncbi:MAG: ComEC family competence protein, partial [Chitinophagaceae bacterium]
MSRRLIPFWKKAPFFRLLLPLVAGILIHWYSPPPLPVTVRITSLSLLLTLSWILVPVGLRFRFRFVPAVSVALLLVCAGMLLVWKKDPRNDPSWAGPSPSYRTIEIETSSSPVEKTGSLKCTGYVSILQDSSGRTSRARAGIWIYLEKHPLFRHLPPGSRLLFHKPLTAVSSSGNPYAFDYQRYSLFQGITHQVYLLRSETVILPPADHGFTRTFLPGLQERVLTIIRRYVPGQREAGLAEALLIGYKPDLDPGLVKSYTDTGLAHVIAISGMHLALVYWILLLLFRPLEKRKGFRWLAPVFTLAGLWVFTLLAGAQPSILRSAVMFSCIVLGRSISRTNPICNSLSASAFILLCYNPFWLWDLGFLLSYAAVASLLIFMDPIYRAIWFRNKFVNMAWQSVATSIAAQVLTLPVSIYSFHQFPNYFVLSNLVAVPVSTAVLFAEIILCAVSFAEPLAAFTGAAISFTLRVLNQLIGHLASLPFATWDGLQVDLLQCIFLYLLVLATWYWLRHKNPKALCAGLVLLFLFMTSRSISFTHAIAQDYILVYNVPKKQVLTRVRGRSCLHLGDSTVATENSFHLAPEHIHSRLHGIMGTDSPIPASADRAWVTGTIN